MNDLVSQPIDYTDDVIDSHYRLVIAAAKRTRQIMEGHAPVGEYPYHKETTIGLAEILEKKVPILMGAPAVVAERKHREVLRAARRQHEESLPPSRGYARESVETIVADVSVYQEDPEHAEHAAPEETEDLGRDI
ncbi:MAG: DNA-directed RNA polymerase subunit omega [Leptospirales bacterium]